MTKTLALAVLVTAACGGAPDTEPGLNVEITNNWLDASFTIDLMVNHESVRAFEGQVDTFSTRVTKHIIACRADAIVLVNTETVTLGYEHGYTLALRCPTDSSTLRFIFEYDAAWGYPTLKYGWLDKP